MEEVVVPGLGSIFLQLPLLVVWLAGMALAIANWSRHPRASALTLIGLILLLVNFLVANVLNYALPLWLHRWGLAVRSIGLASGIRAFLQSLVSGLAWVLILIAIFSRRDEREA